MNDTIARSVFTGLVPERLPATPSGPPRTMNSTMPILLVGTMAMTLNVTNHVESDSSKSPASAQTSGVGSVIAARALVQKSSLPAPTTYRVVAGDTVSGIAARYGLRASSVLALNGLSAKARIFPGQVLRLIPGSSPAATTPTATTAAPAGAAGPASPTTYTVVAGDTISGVAKRFGTTTAVILSLNGLSSSSVIRPGQVLHLPGATPTASPLLHAIPVASITPIAPAAPAAAAPAPAAPPPPAAPAAGVRYTIAGGDTLSAIAARFGVPLQSILDANGLTRSSVIYAGKSILIPGAGAAAAAPAPAAPPTAGPAPSTAGVTLLQDDQAANAFTIITIGRQLGVPDYGITIALATAMQESSLRNLSYGHLDSVGLFQQRPSTGWGSVAQLTTPSYAAALFYGGPSNPNKGKTRGLLDIPNWQSMTLTQAAQKVQVSAYPNAYAKWETSARYWLADLG